MLAGRGIPFLFQTSDPAGVAHPGATVIPKPFRADRLTAVQALLVGREEATP